MGVGKVARLKADADADAGPYVCGICFHKSTYSHGAVTHVGNRHGKHFFTKCVVCRVECDTLAKYCDHFQSAHIDVFANRCPNCQVVMMDLDGFIVHLRNGCYA